VPAAKRSAARNRQARGAGPVQARRGFGALAQRRLQAAEMFERGERQAMWPPGWACRRRPPRGGTGPGWRRAGRAGRGAGRAAARLRPRPQSDRDGLGQHQGHRAANLCLDTIDEARAAAKAGLDRVGSDPGLCFAFLALDRDQVMRARSCSQSACSRWRACLCRARLMSACLWRSRLAGWRGWRRNGGGGLEDHRPREKGL
jgi:hypothetical protein